MAFSASAWPWLKAASLPDTRSHTSCARGRGATRSGERAVLEGRRVARAAARRGKRRGSES
eukprot:scaffold42334_cov65-Phaeocystis_antarctica.AAC.6